MTTQEEIDNENEELEQIKKGNLPLSRLAPNIVTLLALCFGLTSIKVALVGKWELAISCVIISCFLDGIDGRLARFLGATSKFGAQLDSLSDFVNFGVCPALIMFLWSLKDIPNKAIGWGAVLFYSICCAIRLARFNVDLEEDEDEATKKKYQMFFVGLPSPTAAIITLVPIMLYIEYEYLTKPLANVVLLIIVGFLMSSRIPTFSGKKITIHRKIASIVMVLLGFIIGMIILEPWTTLPLLALAYLISIPLSIYVYYKMQPKKEEIISE
ncbi:MAG: phosphatidylcholine/phosphatidylserine synthase [Sphingobacteriia bacterium]|nr:phosphatidylcholine/phosphatidylserine synthase [Sphingobacteriia bacterium]